VAIEMTGGIKRTV